MTTDRRTSADMTDEELFDDGPNAEIEVDLGDEASAIEQENDDLDVGDDEPDTVEIKANDEEDDAGGNADNEEDDEDDDGVEYSKKVQKRINKEVGRRKAEESKRTAAETYAQRVERENIELRARLANSETVAVDATLTGLDRSIEDIKARKAQAYEEGNSDILADLDEELAEAIARKRETQAHKQQRESARATEQPQNLTEQQRREAVIQKLPKRSQDWVKKRGFFDWSEEHRAFSMGVDAKLTRQGLSVDSDEYYQKMDIEIGKVFPELINGTDNPEPEPDHDDDPKPQPKPRKRTEGGSVAGTGTAPSGGAKPGGSKVTLDANDFRQMRTYGLDPQNAEHVTAFAAEKKRSASA